jgi:hypothetical protein
VSSAAPQQNRATAGPLYERYHEIIVQFKQARAARMKPFAVEAKAVIG